MCGIFGFITKRGRGPDLTLLRSIAEITERRGDHAFGLAWLDADNRLRNFKRPGPATADLDDVDRCAKAAIVVGHCRWATHGHPRDNDNNHPHRAGRGWLVHNGVVLNHAALASEFRLQPQSECDSEVLGLLMARFPGTLERRAALTAKAALGHLAILGVWRNPSRLLIVRGGKPLCFGQTKHGLYFVSLPDGLPGRAFAVTDGSASVLTYAAGRVRQQTAFLRTRDSKLVQ